MKFRKGLLALIAVCVPLSVMPAHAQVGYGYNDGPLNFSYGFDTAGHDWAGINSDIILSAPYGHGEYNWFWPTIYYPSIPQSVVQYWADVATASAQVAAVGSVGGGYASQLSSIGSGGFLGGVSSPPVSFTGGFTSLSQLSQGGVTTLVNATGTRGQLQSLPSSAGPFLPTQSNPGFTLPGGNIGLPGGGNVSITGGSINIGGTGGVRLPSATVSFPGAGRVTFGGQSQGSRGGSPTRMGLGNDSRSSGATGEQHHHSSAQDHNSAWIDHWNQPYAPELRPAPNGFTNKTGMNGEATMNMLYRTGMETSTMLLAPGTVTDRPFPSGSFDLGFPARNITPTDGYDPWRGQDQLGALQTQASTSTSSVDADITNGYE